MSYKLMDLINLAQYEEGYIEKASASNLNSKTANKGDKNYTKYSRDINGIGLMGCQAQPWCCTYQFWLEVQIFGVEQALKNWNMTRSSYVGYNCVATYNAFAKVGKVGKTPRIGAIVIFNFSHAGRVIDIYTRDGVKYWSCAEGNTSSNLSDRNGGQVKIKERVWNDPTVKGFCYIDYDVEDVASDKTGWVKKSDGWHFYLEPKRQISNDWYYDSNNRWSWFNGAGVALTNQWYQYKNHWYFFGPDCYMYSSQWIEYKGNQYYLTSDGSMAKSAYIKSKDLNLNIYYWVNEDGIYEAKWDTLSPDLVKYKLVE